MLYIHITLYTLYTKTKYYLGNAYSVNPLMQCSDIVTAQILDVLWFLLNLRVLCEETKDITYIDALWKACSDCFMSLYQLSAHFHVSYYNQLAHPQTAYSLFTQCMMYISHKTGRHYLKKKVSNWLIGFYEICYSQGCQMSVFSTPLVAEWRCAIFYMRFSMLVDYCGINHFG